MGRSDLLELLLQQKQENDRLLHRVEELEKRLIDRQLRISEAGSIAEASLALNGVFEAAQNACSQYIENIQTLSRKQEDLCRAMEQETQEKCEKMIAEAKRISKDYWDEYAARFQAFANSYEGLKGFIEMSKPTIQEAFDEAQT